MPGHVDAGGWALVLLSQVMATGASVLGQRATRVVHGFSRRRFVQSQALVSTVQMVVIAGLVQAIAPAAVTGTVYVNGIASPCYREIDVDGCCPTAAAGCDCVIACNSSSTSGSSARAETAAPAATACHPIECPSQGPGSMFASFGMHPLLGIIGFANVAYYVAEAAVFQQPLALVTLVTAGIFATVLFTPLAALLGADLNGGTPPATALLLGIVGAVLCVLEPTNVAAATSTAAVAVRSRRRASSVSRYTLLVDGKEGGGAGVSYADGDRTSADGGGAKPYSWDHDPTIVGAVSDSDGGNTGRIDVDNLALGGLGFTGVPTTGTGGVAPHTGASINDSPAQPGSRAAGKGTLAGWPGAGCRVWCSRHAVLLPAFLVLSGCYCVWFVFLKMFNDAYRVNAWGFNSFDQSSVFVVLFCGLALCDLVGVLVGVGSWGVDALDTAIVSQSARDGGGGGGGGRTTGGRGATRGGLRDNGAGAVAPGSCPTRCGGAWVRAVVRGYVASLRDMWAELTSSWGAFATVFGFRLFANARAVIYSYLAVWYDVQSVYYELTMVKVLFSWAGAVIVGMLAPTLIEVTSAEQRGMRNWRFVAPKVAGTVLVVLALIIATGGL